MEPACSILARNVHVSTLVGGAIMPVKIGFKPHKISESLALLSDCHRRIERFLYVLITVSRHCLGIELNHEQQRAVETALQYFREAAPKHALDEEESLFPRMRAAGDPQVERVLNRLETLEEEHAILDLHHREVESLFRLWIIRGWLFELEGHHLRTALSKLSRMYHKHIHLEETEVFPLAKQVLKPSEIESIRHEMAARREIVRDAMSQS